MFFYSYIINSLVFHLKLNIMNYFSKSCSDFYKSKNELNDIIHTINEWEYIP